MKVIRPEKEEPPLVAPRPARASPGMPAAVIRLALFALVLAGAGLAVLVFRR